MTNVFRESGKLKAITVKSVNVQVVQNQSQNQPLTKYCWDMISHAIYICGMMGHGGQPLTQQQFDTLRAQGYQVKS